MAPDNTTLTAVPGFRVGHWTDGDALTGCTVVVCDRPTVCGVDVRGAATGTRDLEVCRVPHLTEAIHGLLFGGGSAFGLDAAGGVQREMERDGRGYDVGMTTVPLVPAAIIFDLGIGAADVRPGIEAGAAAYRAATAKPVPRGNVGAGTGATVGKLFGAARAMKGGLGAARRRVGDVTVGALVVVNAFGDVRDPRTGKIVAGLRRESGRGFADTAQQLRAQAAPAAPGIGANTVIGCVATDARLDKQDAVQFARGGSTGIARCCSPAHTPFDGDVVFGLGRLGGRGPQLPLLHLASVAADVMAEAVLDGVRRAKAAGGLPAARRS